MEQTGRGATIVLQPDGVRIPRDVSDLSSFRRWTQSPAFPEKGRIDWIDGELEVDMSPEEINTHGSPKVAIAGDLRDLVEGRNMGVVYIDSTRVAMPAANISVEPDVVVVLFDSVDAGRVRLVPASGSVPGRFVEIEGPPDLLVECVSQSSQTKDRRDLRDAYARGGVPEYWLVDARLDPPSLSIMRARSGAYDEVASSADGFVASPLLALAVRLVRLPPRSGLVRYRLESRPQ